MAARSIPIERSRCVEVWHDACAEYRQEQHEDRVIAVEVELHRHVRAAPRGKVAIIGWPAPIVAPPRTARHSA